MKPVIKKFIRGLKEPAFIVAVLSMLFAVAPLTYTIGLQLGQNRQSYLQDKLNDQANAKAKSDIELAGLRERVTLLTDLSSQLREQGEDFKSQLKQITKERDRIANDREGRFEKLNDVIAQKEAAEKSLRQAEVNIENLKSQITGLNQELKDQRDQNDRRRIAAQNLVNANQKMEDEVSNSAASLKRLNQQVQDVKRKKEILTKAILNMISEKENLIRKLPGIGSSVIFALDREYQILKMDHKLSISLADNDLQLIADGVIHHSINQNVLELSDNYKTCFFTAQLADDVSARVIYYCILFKDM
jgi:DNA repair exonuclease SbcCD ATPase subunit